jgi:hypothetical protein
MSRLRAVPGWRWCCGCASAAAAAAGGAGMGRNGGGQLALMAGLLFTDLRELFDRAAGAQGPDGVGAAAGADGGRAALCQDDGEDRHRRGRALWHRCPQGPAAGRGEKAGADGDRGRGNRAGAELVAGRLWPRHQPRTGQARHRVFLRRHQLRHGHGDLAALHVLAPDARRLFSYAGRALGPRTCWTCCPMPACMSNGGTTTPASKDMANRLAFRLHDAAEDDPPLARGANASTRSSCRG